MKKSRAEQYLDTFINYEFSPSLGSSSIFKLKRIWFLLDALGHPEKDMTFIHVAGSKGKGTTCAFTAEILKWAGYRAGLYTSPHIQNFKERIRVLESSSRHCTKNEIFPDCISEDELDMLLWDARPALDGVRKLGQYGQLSYYEVLTALSLLYFKRRQADVVILETGLGGRLDATNIVDSLVCGITPISLEHVEILGDTVAAVAQEKAGILKKSTKKAVVALQPEGALDVIRARCDDLGLDSSWVGRDITYQAKELNGDRQSFCVQGLKENYNLETRLLGAHQMVNAATAVGLVESLSDFNFTITPQAIEQGIASVVWPGRFEKIFEQPVVILDGAHNEESAQMLAETVRHVYPGRKVILLFGAMRDKDHKGIGQHLSKITKQVILTKVDHPRACDLTKEAALKNVFDGEIRVTRNVKEAVYLALSEAGKDDIILAAGSLYLAADVRSVFHSLGKYKTFQTAENSFPENARSYDDRRVEFF